MTKNTDFLIIGAGIAGLTAAYFLSEIKNAQVTVITKGELKNANTYWAQGGIAAVLSKDDSFESHIQDTLKTGAGHCKKSAVEYLVHNAPKAIKFLEYIGLEFEPKAHLEAGHSFARVNRSSDFTGRDVMNVLIKAVQGQNNITIIEKTDAVELIVDSDRCRGAFVRSSEAKETKPILSKFTILATGGCGQLYGKTTNTLGSGGDGLAMAVNAGLELEDMEFMQFHPTALDKSANGRHFLLSEVLRGFGAKIVNQDEKPFLDKFDKRAELAPRDLVSRAIYFEKANGPVYLDMRHLDDKEVKKQFPNIYKGLKEYDLDLTSDLVPITPVAHYACGGIPVNIQGETALPGLFALGEVACTGVHGANRLASNSLLESIVYAKAISDKLLEQINQIKELPEVSIDIPKVVMEDISQVKAYGQRIGQIMWENVGIIRTTEGLKKAKKEIVTIPARDYRVQHRQLVCYKIIEACLNRPESLGCHYMAKE